MYSVKFDSEAKGYNVVCNETGYIAAMYNGTAKHKNMAEHYANYLNNSAINGVNPHSPSMEKGA